MQRRSVTIILLVLLAVQTGLLVYIADHYNLVERVVLRFQQGRLPLLSEEFQQNRYFQLYEELFQSYRLSEDPIVILGDSMVSVPNWNLLMNRTDDHIYNFGIPGDSLAGVRSRLDTVLQSNPKAVVVWVGINDVLRGHSIDEFQSELDSLQEPFSRYQGRLIFIEIFPVELVVAESERVNKRIKEFNLRLASFAVENDATLLKFDSVLKSVSVTPMDLTVDGIHLSAEGYRHLGQQLHAELKAVP